MARADLAQRRAGFIYSPAYVTFVVDKVQWDRLQSEYFSILLSVWSIVIHTPTQPALYGISSCQGH